MNGFELLLFLCGIVFRVPSFRADEGIVWEPIYPPAFCLHMRFLSTITSFGSTTVQSLPGCACSPCIDSIHSFIRIAERRAACFTDLLSLLSVFFLSFLPSCFLLTSQLSMITSPSFKRAKTFRSDYSCRGCASKYSSSVVSLPTRAFSAAHATNFSEPGPK